MDRESGPETRTIPTPLLPGGVAIAQMVSLSACNDMTWPLGNQLAALASNSFSIERVMYHCWSMPSTLLVSQYSTRPAGNQRKNTVITTGMKRIILACIGSAGAGLSRDWAYIDTPISSGSTKYGSMTDRSLSHRMKGA